MVAGAVGGFVGGYIGSGGNLQAGLAGAATGAIFGGIGSFADGMQAGGSSGWGDGGFNRVLAHAAGGGISSTLQGQKFGPGALAAGFSEEFSPGIKNFSASGQVGVIERTVASAVVGGTASVLGGGKFENGAKTAAFARLFNEEVEPRIGDSSISKPDGLVGDFVRAPDPDHPGEYIWVHREYSNDILMRTGKNQRPLDALLEDIADEGLTHIIDKMWSDSMIGCPACSVLPRIPDPEKYFYNNLHVMGPLP